MISVKPGLRDRKREETRRRLETAAVDLVLRNGLERATVDEISALADVSSRTFFNYFDTKEDAILGIHDAELTPDDIAEHVRATDGADPIESTVMLLIGLIRPSIQGQALDDQRLEVLRRYPQLFSRHMIQMTRMIDGLVKATTTILEMGSAGAGASGAGVSRAEAEVLLTTCGGAVRSAIHEWVDNGAPEPADVVRVRAVELIRSLGARLR
ncbi:MULTISPECIES: TetR/AcrR family transcriptional regulator [unclassified Frondihabitans]|uniref:TetR/AcrR family transcriptional regulator n=1 Tax=unclassified Frondihabitans TaxID=2626248 RepID=UPI000F50B0A1|nr:MULTISPECIES: TetR/AcrR family transcriptional regulator [unclassified Frondihabitans]